MKESRADNGGGSAGGRSSKEICGIPGCWDNKDSGDGMGIVGPDLEAGGNTAGEAVWRVALQGCGVGVEIGLGTIRELFRPSENPAE
jgi:hypothetical protein